MLNAITRTDAKVIQQFGVSPSRYSAYGLPGHDGLDLETEVGQQLYAPVDGVIGALMNDPSGWGRNLVLDFAPNRRLYLCHLDDYQASAEGDFVVAGTPICLAGMTGYTNWPHVHITPLDERDVTGTPYRGRIDPEPWLRRCPL